MKTLLVALAVLAVVAFGAWFLTWEPPPPPRESPLLALFAEPSSTPDVCTAGEPLVECMEARWRADRVGLSSQYTGEQLGSALCWIGIVRNRSLATDGLWRHGCESAPWRLPFEPCLTPRGWIFMTRSFHFDDDPTFKRSFAIEDTFEDIEDHRATLCPRIDRILPRVEDRPFERFAVGTEPVGWPEAATTRRASVG